MSSNRIINASPTKEFFISMLVKDIDLTRSIIDLVDNCIDGAHRTHGDQDYAGLEVHIELSKERFRISDNCGGIPVEIAKNYAFRFGRPEDMESTPYSVGLFGVGMKRAIFKIGKKFRIESTTKNSRFVVEEDVEKWKSQKKWEFKFKALEENLPDIPREQQGTIITVSSLNKSVSDDFGLETFQKKLAKELEAAHLENLSKGIVITINNIPLSSHPIFLLHSSVLKPGYREITFEENTHSPVRAKIYAGIFKPDPTTAGWYIFCNGRLVVEADQSTITGWGEGSGKTIPKYHNDFARFRGYVFFSSEDPKLLPWNTTKTGVDTDSPKFRSVRSEMINLMRPVIDFLRKLSEERSKDSDERPLEIAVESTLEARIFQVSTNNIFLFPKPQQKHKPKTGIIQYSRPIEEIEEVKNVLEAHTYKEVGEKTFEYFLKKECRE